MNGANFDFVGVHLSWPFKPDNQVADVNALITSVHDASVPLILAGDFNLTPWSLKLQRFAKETGLKRVNTWLSTWPANRLLPFVNIDNVFVSPVFSVMDVSTGPYLGSDHRPIIADIALTKDSTKEAAAH